MYRDDRDAKGDRDNRSRIDREIMRTDSIKIPGLHNVENYLAAIAAIAHLVDNDSIIRTASAFRGVEHRNEHVKEINGVNFL